MEDIGSLIFYVILGIIALAGSLQGKNKKQKAPPRKVVQRQPDSATAPPPVRPAPAPARQVLTTQPPQPQPQPRPAATQRRPQYMPADPSMEGRYEEPMAGTFSREGSITQTMAEAFSGEGSINRSMAAAFAGEGSIEDSMAVAFAGEGISSFKDFQTSDFVHTEISDSEIGDVEEYDYNARPGTDILTGGFDLKKAVIYTALLNRKEYSV
jgi:type IV secretory pathway VirB10-like protein